MPGTGPGTAVGPPGSGFCVAAGGSSRRTSARCTPRRAPRGARYAWWRGDPRVLRPRRVVWGPRGTPCRGIRSPAPPGDGSENNKLPYAGTAPRGRERRRRLVRGGGGLAVRAALYPGAFGGAYVRRGGDASPGPRRGNGARPRRGSFTWMSPAQSRRAPRRSFVAVRPLAPPGTPGDGPPVRPVRAASAGGEPMVKFPKALPREYCPAWAPGRRPWYRRTPYAGRPGCSRCTWGGPRGGRGAEGSDRPRARRGPVRGAAGGTNLLFRHVPPAPRPPRGPRGSPNCFLELRDGRPRMFVPVPPG